MKIGYCRVSTDDQNPDLQLVALKRAGCKRIFTDKASGAHVKRPELAKCLKLLKDSDTLIVWKLDRLSLQRHFRVLTKFAHVESRLFGHNRQKEVVLYVPVNLCDRRACSTSVAVGLSLVTGSQLLVYPSLPACRQTDAAPLHAHLPGERVTAFALAAMVAPGRVGPL